MNAGEKAFIWNLLDTEHPLKGFFIADSDRCDGRSPAVASQGNPYYGTNAEIGKEVAKLVPLH